MTRQLETRRRLNAIVPVSLPASDSSTDEEADASEGFSLPAFTNAELEDWFRSVGASEGWPAHQIRNSIIHCRKKDRILCLTARVEALRNLNAIAPAVTPPEDATASPEVPPAPTYQRVASCGAITADEARASACVNG